jgi:hypothetical protein
VSEDNASSPAPPANPTLPADPRPKAAPARWARTNPTPRQAVAVGDRVRVVTGRYKGQHAVVDEVGPGHNMYRLGYVATHPDQWVGIEPGERVGLYLHWSSFTLLEWACECRFCTK